MIIRYSDKACRTKPPCYREKLLAKSALGSDEYTAPSLLQPAYCNPNFTSYLSSDGLPNTFLTYLRSRRVESFIPDHHQASPTFLDTLEGNCIPKIIRVPKD
ncbi:MAG: hypothetical protein ACON5J_01345 [Rubripirellula sp.]